MDSAVEEVIPAAVHALDGVEPAGVGLLRPDETVALLRQTLGDLVPEERLKAAASTLQGAVDARWEQLPPEINPEVGFHFPFLVCTETCWLGRQIIMEGATFRVFRLRE